MNFFNPLGLLFSLFIVGVILLYILKQQHEDIEISSTYLWEKTLHEMEVSKPWQKLQKNILLILQILIILLLALALARPFIVSGEKSSEYIIVLDCSASMQAKDVHPSRFEKSKNEIKKIIEGLLPDEKITLIKSDNQASVVANSIADKSLLKNKLNNIKVTNKNDNIQEAISLSDAILKEREDAKVYIYTDKHFDVNEKYNVIVNNGNGQNVAVTNVNYSNNNDEIIVLSKIHNYGSQKEVNLECLVDGKLRDIKDINFNENEIQNIYWDKIVPSDTIVEINITNEDDLTVDNKGFTIINESRKSKTLMVTDSNVFLEKAINLRNNLELNKSTITQLDDIESIDGYDLYIFDGKLPKQLPADGNIIIVNPSSEINEEIQSANKFTPDLVEINTKSQYQDIVEFINVDSFNIRQALNIKIPSWGEMILKSGNKPILICGEKNDQRIIIFTFDLHDSDLPLKSEFPILIQNILSWMLPDVVDNNINVYSGQDIIINSLPKTQSITIEIPSGNVQKLKEINSTIPFVETSEVGVYKVNQQMENKNLTGYFTVMVDENESNILTKQNNIDINETNANSKEESSAFKKNLWYYFAWCALAFILIEWWVYHRGY